MEKLNLDFYTRCWENSDMPFCIMKVIVNEQQEPVDMQIVYSNNALETHVNRTKEFMATHTFMEFSPILGKKWLPGIAKIAFQGFIDNPEEEIDDNGMSMRLKCFPIIQGYVGIVHYIQTELQALKRTNEENLRLLQKTVEEKAQITKDRQFFLSCISHDIRNIVSYIMGYADLACDAKKIEDTIKYARKTRVTSKQLMGIVCNVVDISYMEKGQAVFNQEIYALEDLMNGVCDILSNDIQKKHLTLERNFTGIKDVMVLVDKVYLNRILLNLLDNAHKYTPEGGKLFFTVRSLSCKHAGYGRFQFRIKDTGVGMTPEVKDIIFDPYCRGNNAIVKSHRGAGLGMVIVKKIVDLMDGTITVESEEGKGTEFVVTLELNIMGEEVEA